MLFKCESFHILLLVLVLNNNMYIDIKPYFCLPYRLILKYRVMRCFPRDAFQTLSKVLVVSQNVNKCGVSILSVSES